MVAAAMKSRSSSDCAASFLLIEGNPKHRAIAITCRHRSAPDPPFHVFFGFTCFSFSDFPCFSGRLTPKILGKESKNTPRKQGKSQKKQSKEIQKAWKRGIRGGQQSAISAVEWLRVCLRRGHRGPWSLRFCGASFVLLRQGFLEGVLLRAFREGVGYVG